MTTSGKILFAVAIGLATGLASSPATAQTPTRIAENGDWGAYSAQANGGKTCYILSVPTEKQPNDRDHGDVYFMLAQYPGQSASLEPQFTVGYPFKEESKVVLDIDGRKFTMFTRGQNAWLENQAEETAVVDAMRAGRRMSVSAESRRGTQTRYTYSLSGVTASLQQISPCN